MPAHVKPIYEGMDAALLSGFLKSLYAQYDAVKAKGLGLDMTRGRPCAEQLALSSPLLSMVTEESGAFCENGADCRNYTPSPDGIPEAKRFFGELLGADPANVFVGGNSSLSLMYDSLAFAYIHGLPESEKPWGQLPKVKFLCPSPGYDRHFAITAHLGFELISVPMTPGGPDMDVVEELVKDPAVKGIWCVPKYSNPQGYTYNDDTVCRFAALSPAAKDFRIFWDNAYAVHDFEPEKPEILLSLMGELIKNGREDMAFLFGSTSKITYAGGGVAAVASGKGSFGWLLGHKRVQIISYDKVNMLRHTRMFPDVEKIVRHMEKHAEILRPKFEAVNGALRPLGDDGIASWHKPRGGYFVSLDVLPGCAGRVVSLCKEAGAELTSAGATYPYGNDPEDKNIRIAPSVPSVKELNQAMELLCLCVRISSVEKYLRD